MIDNCALINTFIHLFLSKCMDVDIYLFIHSFINMAGLVLHTHIVSASITNPFSKLQLCAKVLDICLHTDFLIYYYIFLFVLSYLLYTLCMALIAK